MREEDPEEDVDYTEIEDDEEEELEAQEDWESLEK